MTRLCFHRHSLITKKNSYSIKLNTGVNSYDYLSTGGNDQLRFFSKLGSTLPQPSLTRPLHTTSTITH
ncbi:MAG: hypothetical protein L0922_03055, partial [Candidatus Mariimomonas ferrooxydans]